MAEVVKQTVKTEDNNSSDPVIVPQVQTKATNYQTIEYLIYFLFGALEVLLVFRLILKLTGANSLSSFVSIIYSISGIFILPFQGIFPPAVAKGVVTAAVLEPATVVAIIVYAVVAVGVVQLIRILSKNKQVD